MTATKKVESTADIPTKIFEEFLQALGNSDVSTELIARLRKTLLADNKFTELVLREAVLNEEGSS